MSSNALRWLPIAFFALLAGIFAYALLFGGSPETLPSVLIGKPAPALSLPGLDGSQAGLSSDVVFGKGKPVVLNVFASWCAPCEIEHPLLMQLSARPDVTVVGIAYKDKPANTRAFLARLGNPFDAIGSDATGRAVIDWGVYGVPETYVIDAEGKIAYKHVGPLDEVVLADEILPLLVK